ncbi:MAG TPA: LysR family transcriptional regulator [Stellaceae bacterium]|nr:LysR family transcriptional regulator [Stellaceae bacterium]
MRELNLGHLRTFAQVVALGSFSAAAEQAKLTQPAISLQMRQLEARLGLRLLERIGRRVQPTAAGADLLKHIRQIEAAVEGALETVAYHRTGTAGRVRLGTGATACIYLLPPMLRQLRASFPKIEIVVSTGNSPAILKAVEENALDLALVTLPAPGRIFHVTPILADELVAVFPVDGPPPPATVTAATLAARPVVLYEPGGNARRVVDGWFARAGLALKPAMELGSVEAIKELVGAGLGCAVLPRLAVTGAGARQDIVLRSLSPRLHRRLGLVLRRDKRLDRGLREVIRALERLGPAGKAARKAVARAVAAG